MSNLSYCLCLSQQTSEKRQISHPCQAAPPDKLKSSLIFYCENKSENWLPISWISASNRNSYINIFWIFARNKKTQPSNFPHPDAERQVLENSHFAVSPQLAPKGAPEVRSAPRREERCWDGGTVGHRWASLGIVGPMCVIFGGFPKMGVPPKSSKSLLDRVGIETHGDDLGILHFFSETTSSVWETTIWKCIFPFIFGDGHGSHANRGKCTIGIPQWSNDHYPIYHLLTMAHVETGTPRLRPNALPGGVSK